VLRQSRAAASSSKRESDKLLWLTKATFYMLKVNLTLALLIPAFCHAGTVFLRADGISETCSATAVGNPATVTVGPGPCTAPNLGSTLTAVSTSTDASIIGAGPGLGLGANGSASTGSYTIDAYPVGPVGNGFIRVNYSTSFHAHAFLGAFTLTSKALSGTFNVPNIPGGVTASGATPELFPIVFGQVVSIPLSGIDVSFWLQQSALDLDISQQITFDLLDDGMNLASDATLIVLPEPGTAICGAVLVLLIGAVTKWRAPRDSRLVGLLEFRQ
jgi:hypothetical protein